MIKYIVVLVTLFVSICGFSQNNVLVDIKSAEEVQAGKELIVNVTISKGNLESFSRFQQDLPLGLTASRVSTSNADFTFENQRVRIIWLKMPAEPQITISYKILVDDRLKGSFPLSAEFSYIFDNERKSIPVEGASKINILPSPNLPSNQVVDISEFKEKYGATADLADLNSIKCVRSAPFQNNPREIIVELLIRKGNLSQFVRVEEYIPEGFSASEMDSKDGIFSFQNQTVKILWMNLPDEEEFTVSYKLFPSKGKTINDLVLTGAFSYIEGSQTKIINITNSEPELAMQKIPEKEEKKEAVKVENITKPVEEITKPAEKITRATEKSTVQTPVTTRKQGGDKWLLQAETGIYYRLQIAAGRRTINIDSQFNHPAVKGKVKYEMHEGWRKYTIGSFSDYSEAEKFKEDLQKYSFAKNAFIVAYNNGKRISMQEALVLSSRKQ
jgi:hypothetical protein